MTVEKLFDINQNAGVLGEGAYDDIKKYTKSSGDILKELLSVLEDRHLDGSWANVADEIEAESEIYRLLGDTLTEQMVKPLKNLFESQLKTKREVESQVGKATEKLAKRRTEQIKLKRKAYSVGKEAEKIQRSVDEETRRAVRLLSSKQIAKLQSKKQKLEEVSLEADKSYQERVLDAERARQSVEHSVTEAAEKLESLEIQRLAQMQYSLGTYRQCLSAKSPQLAEICGKKAGDNFFNIDAKSDLQTVLAQSRPAKVPNRIWVLCDFPAEDFSSVINPDRRVFALQRCQVWFEKDLEKERRQKENNLSYTYTDGSKTQNAGFQTRINDCCQMMNFLFFHHQKLQNSIDAVTNRPETVLHPLTKYLERTKDKANLRQSIIRIPAFACKSLVIPPLLASMDLKRGDLNNQLQQSASDSTIMANPQQHLRQFGSIHGSGRFRRESSSTTAGLSQRSLSPSDSIGIYENPEDDDFDCSPKDSCDNLSVDESVHASSLYSVPGPRTRSKSYKDKAGRSYSMATFSPPTDETALHRSQNDVRGSSKFIPNGKRLLRSAANFAHQNSILNNANRAENRSLRKTDIQTDTNNNNSANNNSNSKKYSSTILDTTTTANAHLNPAKHNRFSDIRRKFRSSSLHQTRLEGPKRRSDEENEEDVEDEECIPEEPSQTTDHARHHHMLSMMPNASANQRTLNVPLSANQSAQNSTLQQFVPSSTNQHLPVAATANQRRSSYREASRNAISHDAHQGDDYPRCRALYSYQAIRCDELSLVENDVITILDQSIGDWWRGRNGQGAVGLFPSNYVELMS